MASESKHESVRDGRPATPRQRNRRGRGDQLRAELLAAAEAVLDETGSPAAVTVRGVTSAVGVAPTAFYLHFADRDSLLADIAIARFTVCAAAVRATAAGIDDPVDAFLAGHEEYCRLALERPGHYRLLFGSTLESIRGQAGEELRTAGLDYFESCKELCRRMVASGRIGDVDPDALAVSVWALEHGWCELALTAHMAGLLAPARDVVATVITPMLRP